MERAMGIEPTSEAWEAPVLPLNYARSRSVNSTHDVALEQQFRSGKERIQLAQLLRRIASTLARGVRCNAHWPPECGLLISTFEFITVRALPRSRDFLERDFICPVVPSEGGVCVRRNRVRHLPSNGRHRLHSSF